MRFKSYFPSPENKFWDLSNHQTHSRSHFSKKPWRLQEYIRNVRLKVIFLALKISFGTSPTTKPTPRAIFLKKKHGSCKNTIGMRFKSYFPSPENKFWGLSNHQTHSRSHFLKKPWQLQEYNRNARLKVIFLPLKISFGASPTTRPTPGVIF